MSAPASSPDIKDGDLADPRLLGVWSREHLAGLGGGANDTRIIYLADGTGRYETWSGGLTEVITFRWRLPAPQRVTMEGMEYVFRDAQVGVRREPCDWHFPAIPYEIRVEQVPAGSDMPVLRLHFGGGRSDRFGLVTSDLTGWDDFHF
jgi:hypothetical protein